MIFLSPSILDLMLIVFPNISLNPASNSFEAIFEVSEFPKETIPLTSERYFETNSLSDFLSY
ncbi:hypothetical protein D3C87_1445460 [compost metagenome]